MSKEQFPHIPEIKTTPETVLEEAGLKPERAKEKITPEQLESSVEELMELSSYRAEAVRHRAEYLWKSKELGEKLAGDPRLEELNKDVKEYDKEILNISKNPDTLEAYKEKFGALKETLGQVFAYEHLQKEFEAVLQQEQNLREEYAGIGKSLGPVQRKRLKELEDRQNQLTENITKFELNPATIDMLRRREVRRVQRDLEKYNFAETNSRTNLISEILPDLKQGKPTLFQGETGSGKSQLAKYVSERYLEKSAVLIPIHEQIKESQVLGKTEFREGATQYIYSQFVNAIKEGRPVIFDEINRMPPEFASIFHDLLQKEVGDVFVHPVTGEKIPIKEGFAIFGTANLKSERYRFGYDVPPEVLRRFQQGAGVREIHYLDFGKKDKDGRLIAPETLRILSAVLADRRGDIPWSLKDAPQKLDELKRFAAACRKIQEDFTLSIQEGAEETQARSEHLAFKELVITLKNQINIIEAWKKSDFREPLDKVILKEYFHKAEIGGRPAKDRANMIRVFMANKFFKDVKPEEFKVAGLEAQQIRAWQGKE